MADSFFYYYSVSIAYFLSHCDQAAHMFLFFFLSLRPPPISTLFPYTTLFRSAWCRPGSPRSLLSYGAVRLPHPFLHPIPASASYLASFPVLLSSLLRSQEILSACECVVALDRKSTRLNSSH